MPSNSITSPKYKDSVFRMLFNDKKELLSLYNALNNSSHTNPDDIIINTIGDSTFLKVKNDVSFIFNYELNVFEHQSTPCPNMPLRDLFYVAKLLKKITQEDDLYASKLVKIPTPKFYVFYNGTEPLPDEKIYRLSEQFEKQTATPDIELTVTVLNINEGNNKKLMAACNTLKSYSIFVSLVRKYIKEIPKDIDDKEEEIKSAINHAIQDCIDQDILKAFFEKHRREVQDMTYWDYNEELHNKTIATEATEKAALEIIRFGREEAIPDEKTRLRIKRLGLSDATIDELFAQIDAETANLIQ
ncbi:hypothetical protein [Butyrivibrio sp. VCB2001]|uniref:hypothetical protein n=1 Tax=Butyrivibrio sp. VCB2001 TaxID=1280667 RepID=UPI00040AFDBE|nr:hypothetical protein [Butyrivibrio sp. VCB2001]